MPAIRLASPNDAPALQALVQRAYRGEAARAGWTHEADLLDGERVSLAEVAALLAAPSERILVAEEDDAPIGCVRVAGLGEGRAYLGMLAVEPGRQAGGLGRALVGAAEQFARDTLRASHIEMTVIDSRAELIAWYQRRGYRATGTCPFPLAVEPPLAMVVLEKPL